MRTLTTNELKREMMHRVTLRLRRAPSALDFDLIALIAEMIELSKTPVPACYQQATGDRDSWAMGTRPGGCARCGGRCGGDCG